MLIGHLRKYFGVISSFDFTIKSAAHNFTVNDRLLGDSTDLFFMLPICSVRTSDNVVKRKRFLSALSLIVMPST